MSKKVFKIKRTSRNGRWDKLSVTHYVDDRFVWTLTQYNYNGIYIEGVAVYSLINDVIESSNVADLKTKFYEGFCQLRENDSDGNSENSMENFVDSREPHSSCKSNKKDSTAQLSNGKQISQCEIRNKLGNFKEDSKVTNFFEENKCSVCLGSYKEILDDKFHIVVPRCGHPLCCKCADEILASEKKECPRCKGNITADSFNLMKFNADLELDVHEQNVFL